MRGSQCLCNSPRALYRVFSPRLPSSSSSSEAPPPETISAAHITHLPPFFLHHGSSHHPLAPQFRSYAVPARSNRSQNQSSANGTPSGESEDRTYDRRFTTQRDIDRSGRDRPPWDHEITDPQVMVIDGGVVEGPLNTRYVLTKLDAEESLRMIQPYVPADAKESRDAQFAVCKIVNKKDEYERQKQVKERKKNAAAAKPKTKELEITWAISGNDLETKMGRLRSFLTKGMKVELTIGKKKGGRAVTQDEAGDILKKVRHEMEQYGGREGKPATGQIGGTMKLYLEGTAKKG
ncbi:hypothetical protein PT974_07448 [Cladobotryum mycophilum]|uniref:Translation initiation factor 3 C-terminal domain-containing protein n=1 Tax=Cladobotryum mycophilum TaxID=491253 RepID=A0ABR0SPI7_9HYPO